MTSSDEAADTGAKTMFTWRSVDGGRFEQVRLNTVGGRLRAYGRIISAQTPEVEAYSSSYELVANDIGVTRRLSFRVLKAGGDAPLDLSRDMDGRWMVQTPYSTVQSDFDGAEGVDVAMSPFLSALPIFRHKFFGRGALTDVPLVSLRLPTFEVEPATASYTIGDGTATITTESGTVDLVLDEDGMVLDYPGVATRI
ncbi:putative glycolipid-binding domain-containing protein [Gordonia sp. HY442]|uniref:putative glycolipid-binding domain-containing protein n=1 Tax=Gordonia zhenghanii TaxID=2911516 RepID=UPI001F394DE5|nr:putative glycolipid-binding domain-containing protein [Gordonia zhenghanii]MCF8604215.1 putative glycolipid-binding domain-containing protein [Gordonia zhenghanii]